MPKLTQKPSASTQDFVTRTGRKFGRVILFHTKETTMIARFRIRIRKKDLGKYSIKVLDRLLLLVWEEMEVDHVNPIRCGGEDDISNMLPACRSCNHYKSALKPEEFRKYLSGIPKRLMRDSIPFQVGERFGIVRIVTDDVTFYYEKIKNKNRNRED